MKAERTDQPEEVVTQTWLLATSAAIEWLAGCACIAFPAMAIAVLFGTQTEGMAPMVARVAGVALIALSVAWGGAARQEAGPARRGALVAATVYNAGAGLLLIAFAMRGMADGPVVWIAGILHLGLASALVTGMFTGIDFVAHRHA